MRLPSFVPVVFALSAALLAADPAPVALPEPQTTGGKPLMQALKERCSQREFKADPLPAQLLSNLLWAAAGVNRPDGHRTAPTAHNRQEIDVYVALESGLYLYEPKKHALVQMSDQDLRAATGTQAFAATAPVNLVYAADFSRTEGGSEEDKLVFAAAAVGFISQNVYLFCASEGLATVVRASFDRAVLPRAMKLRPEQRIILAQTVGYSK